MFLNLDATVDIAVSSLGHYPSHLAELYRQVCLNCGRGSRATLKRVRTSWLKLQKQMAKPVRASISLLTLPC